MKTDSMPTSSLQVEDGMFDRVYTVAIAWRSVVMHVWYIYSENSFYEVSEAKRTLSAAATTKDDVRSIQGYQITYSEQVSIKPNSPGPTK